MTSRNRLFQGLRDRLVGGQQRLAPTEGAIPDNGVDDLDVVFYARHYRDLAGLDEAALRRHFRTCGLGEGRARSADELITRLEARYGPCQVDFDPDAYRRAHPDLASIRSEPWQFTAHYLEHGRHEGRDAPDDPTEVEACLRRNVERLRPLHARAPDDVELARHLARALALAGQGQESRAVFPAQADLPARPGAADDASLLALGRYVEEAPLGRVLGLLDAVHARNPLADAIDVAQQILHAKLHRAPLAVVRFGDGEGAFMGLGPEDEAAHRALHAHNRAAWTRYWFGATLDPVASGFEATALGLPNVVAQSDVLGVPYPGWIAHEYAVGSPRGIVGLANIVRWLAAHEPIVAGRRLVSQMIHLHLAMVGLFPLLLQDEPEVGLIACFPELPERLRARFGIGTVDFYKLPGEQHFRGMIGDEAAEGQHFPDVYRSIIARLSRPHEGKVFLVAGGILGKFYAVTIRRHGGIAIDIGSLADVWAGKATRTGYETLPGFGLT